VRDVIYSGAQGKLTIFEQDGLINCIRESFEFETYEQLANCSSSRCAPNEYSSMNLVLTRFFIILMAFLSRIFCQNGNPEVTRKH